MQSTASMDWLRELLDREYRGDFGAEGLGLDLQWFADQWKTVRGLRMGELVVKPVEHVFTVFRTITLGLHPSVEAYLTALKSADFKIGDIARQMLAKVTVSSEQATYELYVATTAELGFPKGATFAQISARVVELGYQLCPAEVGLVLRLAYQDQPLNEWLRIVMEPISDSDGDPSVFRVGHGVDARWLDSHWIRPDFVWFPDRQWVFCRPVPVASK